MKHEASRKKTVSPLPRKSSDQTKVAKKTANDVAVKARNSISVKAVKNIVSKPAPVVSTQKPKQKLIVKKQLVTDKSKKAATLNKKTAAAVNKLSPVISKKNIKQKPEKVASKIVVKANKTILQKPKPAIVKKNQTEKISAAKTKSKVTIQFEKPKAKKIEPKTSNAKSVKKVATAKINSPKNQTAKNKTEAVNAGKSKAEKIIKTGKIVGKNKNSKTVVSAEKVSAAAPKLKPTVSKTKNGVREIKKLALVDAKKKNNQKTPASQPKLSVKQGIQSPKKTPLAVSQKPLSKAKNVKAETAPKIVKTSAVAAKVKTAPVKKVRVKATESPVEIVSLPLPKPKKKKVKPIGAAIFRGKKERYDFQVFPVDGEFEDAAAIYIISKRVVDKRKRAHHKMVCIGQTSSILSELKKHRKGKCFKQHQANAVSVLREENEQKRLKIEADLKSAHAIPCPHA